MIDAAYAEVGKLAGAADPRVPVRDRLEGRRRAGRARERDHGHHRRPRRHRPHQRRRGCSTSCSRRAPRSWSIDAEAIGMAKRLLGGIGTPTRDAGARVVRGGRGRGLVPRAGRDPPPVPKGEQFLPSPVLDRARTGPGRRTARSMRSRARIGGPTSWWPATCGRRSDPRSRLPSSSAWSRQPPSPGACRCQACPSRCSRHDRGRPDPGSTDPRRPPGPNRGSARARRPRHPRVSPAPARPRRTDRHIRICTAHVSNGIFRPRRDGATLTDILIGDPDPRWRWERGMGQEQLGSPTDGPATSRATRRSRSPTIARDHHARRHHPSAHGGRTRRWPHHHVAAPLPALAARASRSCRRSRIVAAPSSAFLVPPKTERGAGRAARSSSGRPADIPPGTGKVVAMGSKPAIVVNTDQGVKAYSAICTHLGCIVACNDHDRPDLVPVPRRALQPGERRRRLRVRRRAPLPPRHGVGRGRPDLPA